jgi:integrase
MLRLAKQEKKIQIVPHIPLLKEPPARSGFLPLEKFQELLALLPGHLRPLIMFLYWCGVRVGEALQIEWPQVDLDARLIHLTPEQTKNADPRTVPLPSELVAVLSEMEPKEGRVFDATNLRKEWEKACTLCGLGTQVQMDNGRNQWLKYQGLIIHDLRRSAVRNLRLAGVPEGVIMKISGHKTRAVFDRYNIVATEDVLDAMRRAEISAAKNGRGKLISAKIVKKQPGPTHKRLQLIESKQTGP